jgi:Dullard-like phosphatase family protein
MKANQPSRNHNPKLVSSHTEEKVEALFQKLGKIVKKSRDKINKIRDQGKESHRVESQNRTDKRLNHEGDLSKVNVSNMVLGSAFKYSREKVSIRPSMKLKLTSNLLFESKENTFRDADSRRSQSKFGTRNIIIKSGSNEVKMNRNLNSHRASGNFQRLTAGPQFFRDNLTESNLKSIHANYKEKYLKEDLSARVFKSLTNQLKTSSKDVVRNSQLKPESQVNSVKTSGRSLDQKSEFDIAKSSLKNKAPQIPNVTSEGYIKKKTDSEIKDNYSGPSKKLENVLILKEVCSENLLYENSFKKYSENANEKLSEKLLQKNKAFSQSFSKKPIHPLQHEGQSKKGIIKKNLVSVYSKTKEANIMTARPANENDRDSHRYMKKKASEKIISQIKSNLGHYRATSDEISFNNKLNDCENIDQDHEPKMKEVDFLKIQESTSFIDKLIKSNEMFSVSSLFMNYPPTHNFKLSAYYDYLCLILKEVLMTQAMLFSDEAISIHKLHEQILEPSKISKISSKRNRTLVIDLDETLVHSEPYLEHKKYDHVLSLTRGRIGVLIRPYLDKFLNQLNKNFNLILFTASGEAYATKVIDIIDPKCKYFSKFYTRSHCMLLNGNNVKSLRAINIIEKEDVMIIDNAIYAFPFDLSNTLLVKPFYGEADDIELLKVRKVIDKYSKSADSATEFIRRAIDWKSLMEVKTLPELFTFFKPQHPCLNMSTPN